MFISKTKYKETCCNTGVIGNVLNHTTASR